MQVKGIKLKLGMGSSPEGTKYISSGEGHVEIVCPDRSPPQQPDVAYGETLALTAIPRVALRNTGLAEREQMLANLWS